MDAVTPSFDTINANNQTVQSSAAATTTTSSSGSATNIASDFETFLRMLTVQVQNQDPLNPTDPTEYATQLAQFSSVEQQVLTNDLLKDLQQTLSPSLAQQAGTLLGMEALSDSPVYFNTSPIVLRPGYSANTNSAQLVVRDANGTEIERFALDPTEDDTIVWAGFDDQGELMPAGVYQFEVETFDTAGDLIATTPSQAYNPIVEVRNVGTQVMARLSDGTEINAANIAGLRAP